MAGEPESLSTDEPLAERIERHDFNRLIMLSDGVFAIAITLLALDMKLPEQWDGSLGGLAYGAGRSLVGYIFAFLLVGAFWMAHRRMFAKFVRVDRIATLLNVLVLGFIGLAPFVARLIAEKGPTRSIPVYLLLTGAIFASYAAIYAYGGFRRLLHHEIGRQRFRREALGLTVGAVIILGTGIVATFLAAPPPPMLLIVVALGAGIAARFTRATPST
jgi:uncharacterized membrane protein